jgi:hypothetical protein
MIKMFKQYYVGLRGQANNTVPLGFATPYEQNKQFEKRKATITSWISHHRGVYDHVKKAHVEVNHPQPIIIDNIPTEGFRIAEEIRRTGWNGGNVVWRIHDPRGFEAEISSANLSRIIDSVGILSGGNIPARCVWGRMGNQNVLVPENSDMWSKLFDASKPTLSSSIVKLGDVCVNKSGDMITYFGEWNLIAKQTNYDHRSQHQIISTKLIKNIHLFSVDDGYRVYKKFPNIIDVVGTTDVPTNVPESFRNTPSHKIRREFIEKTGVLTLLAITKSETIDNTIYTNKLTNFDYKLITTCDNKQHKILVTAGKWFINDNRGGFKNVSIVPPLNNQRKSFFGQSTTSQTYIKDNTLITPDIYQLPYHSDDIRSDTCFVDEIGTTDVFTFGIIVDGVFLTISN